MNRKTEVNIVMDIMKSARQMYYEIHKLSGYANEPFELEPDEQVITETNTPEFKRKYPVATYFSNGTVVFSINFLSDEEKDKYID